MTGPCLSFLALPGDLAGWSMSVLAFQAVAGFGSVKATLPLRKLLPPSDPDTPNTHNLGKISSTNAVCGQLPPPS